MIYYLQFEQKGGYMRISNVQMNTFNGLKIYNREIYEMGELAVNKCRERLASTKHVDLIYDSHGFAIKKKMTEVLQRIQSFSLFPYENAVGINVNGNANKIYKFKLKTLDEAKQLWNDLVETCRKNRLEGYTKIILMIENQIANTKPKRQPVQNNLKNNNLRAYY